VYLVEEESARTLGFDGAANLTLSSKAPWREGELIARLAAMANEKRLSVVGEASFRLLPGFAAKISAGGEFQIAGGAEISGIGALIPGKGREDTAEALDRLSQLA